MPTVVTFQVTVPDGKEADFGSAIGALSAALALNTEFLKGGPVLGNTPTPPPPPTTPTGPRLASAKQIAAIHAIYKDLGVTDKESKITAVKTMLNKTNLVSIDNLTSFEASKVISALKESQETRTNAIPTPTAPKELEPF